MESEEQAISRVSPISGCAPPVEHQFKSGQSGNPKGRPVGKGLSKRVRKLFRASKIRGKNLPRDMIGFDLVAEGLFLKAAKGDVAAVKLIMDLIDGKDTPKLEITGRNGGPIEIDVTQASDAELLTIVGAAS